MHSRDLIIADRTLDIVPPYRGLIYIDKETTMITRMTLNPYDIPITFPIRDVKTVLRRVQGGDIPPPRLVNPRVTRALESIVLKAMALRPEGRYATARALAEDLEHWLADEPVSAYREPLTTTLLRWLTRHRVAVASVAAAALVALVGLGGIAVVSLGHRQTDARFDRRR